MLTELQETIVKNYEANMKEFDREVAEIEAKREKMIATFGEYADYLQRCSGDYLGIREYYEYSNLLEESDGRADVGAGEVEYLKRILGRS